MIYKMLGWIVALVIWFCLVVVLFLYWFERKDWKEKKRDTVFVATFEKVGMDSIEDSLHAMINRAEREIILVTPWITEGIWERIRGNVLEFARDGGKLRVFIKGMDDDFSSGRSDYSVVEEIRKYGGKVKFVPKLHAKVYVVDRREVLICSANLSRSGLDFGYEAGVWSCDPGIVKGVGKFVNRLKD